MHGFGQKKAIFLLLYFREKRTAESVSRYHRKKNRVSRLKKQQS